MLFDRSAHATLVTALRVDADRLEQELATICAGAIANHASAAQIGNWIVDAVLGDDDQDGSPGALLRAAARPLRGRLAARQD
jgi:hypothetical protein